MPWNPRDGGTIDELARFQQPSVDHMTLRIRVITPILGSGVTKTEEDPVSPIRATAIRGQLRFWWRAIYGSRSSSIVEMKRREDALWGRPTSRSLVSLLVEAMHPPPKPLDIQADFARQPGLQYGAFPARKGKKGAPGTRLLRLDETQPFHALLRIQFHAADIVREEVLNSVRAWLLLGGVGGRTRRGFGAVELVDDDLAFFPLPANLKKWLETLASNEPTLPSVPALGPGSRPFWPREQGTNGREALDKGLLKLKEFRSGTRAKEGGVSKWPEADAIRTIRGRGAKRRNWGTHVGRFPRAAFGLPIQFHFVGEIPETEEVLPAGSMMLPLSRWPSRLIIRPARVSSGNYRCFALLLKSAPPAGLALRESAGRPLPWDLTEPMKSITASQDPLLVGTAHYSDALEAFLAYFSSSA